MNFKGFITSGLRNHWIREPGLSLYVRKSVRQGIDYDLASLQADTPGEGAFSRFLDKYEDAHIFYVECILNPRLVPYLTRRGYKLVNSSELETNMRGPSNLFRGTPSRGSAL